MIVHFKSQAQLSAEDNLAVFITFARDKIKLWENLENFKWDSSHWPTHFRKIRFLNLAERNLHPSKDILAQHLMTPKFIDFAKAYIRYNQQKNQTKTFKRIIAALQLLEASLIELDGEADVTKVSDRHLNKAVALLQDEGFKDRQGISLALKQIASDLSALQMAVSNIKYWKHPFTGFQSDEKALKRDTDPSQKLPENDALLALAEIFANGYTTNQDDEDIFITCITALLLSAPMRINEILYFCTNPLCSEKDSTGNDQLHISYWVPKNGKYVRKEIPEIMAGHAQEAGRRLRTITEESRNLARHYESGSELFYRHKDCPDLPDDKELTRDEVVKALGFNSRGSVEDYIKKHTGSYSLIGWTLNSLWKLVLNDHRQKNPYFPYQVDPSSSNSGKPMKMSESLMCFRYQQLSTKNKTSPILLAPMNRDFFSKRLDGRFMKRGDKLVNMSFFLKHDYDGFTLKSHQLRHFLNTLAQEAGVGIDAITEWSTRASMTQSRTYMHQSDERKAQKASEKLGLIPSASINPVTESEYLVMKHGPIITTRYGICTHDYTLTPCNKHADCLNCSELLLCKGHKKSIQAIQQERDHVAENLAAAQSEIDAGKRVAGRWHEAHSKTLARIDQLLKVMTDPNLEDGSAIQIDGKGFSHETRIMDQKEEQTQLKNNDRNLSFTYSDDIADCLKMLQEEING
jgi:hypothetical protein